MSSDRSRWTLEFVLLGGVALNGVRVTQSG